MLTNLHRDRSPSPETSGSFFGGLASLASLLTGRPWNDSVGQGNREEWNQWVFMHLRGYEVHVAGPGIPTDPGELENWEPLLDDISTLMFRSSPVVAVDGDVSADAAQLGRGLGALVDRLGPLLASDRLRWVVGPEHPEYSMIGELQAKSFVAEKIIRDYDVTESIVRQALEVEPRNPDILGDFALFLQEVRGDLPQAEALFQRALQADPGHGRNLGNFAILLHEGRKDDDRAELYYLRALEAEPENATHLGNLALFLHEIRAEDDQAETFFRRALVQNGDDATLLANFALFLHDTRRDDALAETLYRRALLADGTDANCLGNFALFLKNVRHDHDQAEAFFRRALQADPDHAGHLANFALFMKNVRRDCEAAEELYHRALRADPDDPNNLGDFASFMHNLRRKDDVAEDLYQRSLQLDPGSATRLGNFVQLLLSQGRVKEGMPLLDKALSMRAPNPTLNLELWFYVLAHDTGRFEQALRRVKGFIVAGVRSKGWDLRANCHRARQAGHPEPELLEVLAKVIADQEDARALDPFAL
ncbi:MAG: hypothetical protein HQM02_13455, partial [Magnetococcales bacterium]|nr:hypothetical protein [Magnetococcales bacterium]